MPAKAVLEKRAWEWALKRRLDRISEEDLKTAYRVNCPPCKLGSCRKNCSGNPNCFNHLQSFQTEHSENEDNSIKLKGNFVGLKNLGSTCYVNSLLQVWFHNIRFCSVLFSYNAFPDVTSGCHTAIPTSSSSSDELPAKKLRCNYVTATNTIQHLQLLFTRLCYSQQKYIDPTDFVNSLSLKHNEQQDAQEFRNLFLGWLENTLQKELTLSNFIKNEFRGTSSYITTCSNCGNSSTVQSDYGELELNIQGLKNINDSLSDFFKEETLTGDNQYYCHQCCCKQDATRKVKLSSVPRVLNLQLLRFVYDMSLLAKVKVSSHILFPESLDLSQYGCRTDGETFKFHLTGVIIHRGPTAYSGHYIAHILDENTGEWYRFDDELVSKLDKKYLGEEEDEAMLGLSSKKKPRCPKGYHASANAYLLVYSRDDSEESTNKVEAPSYLREIVEEENTMFLESLQQSKAEMTANTLKSNETHEEINSIFASLPPNEDDEFEWISTEWLTAWLTGIDPGPICNAQYLCEHKLLSPDSVVKLKRVNSKTVETLFTKYGDTSTIRLSQSLMCRQCVTNKCCQLQLKQQIGSDYKRLCNLAKSSADHDDGYWIGKKSFQCWRRLYHLSNDINEETADQQLAGDVSCDPPNKNDDSPTTIKSFNEDLLCTHGELCADESKRRLLPSKAWEILLQYFPKAVLFKAEAPACSICLASLSDSAGELQLVKQFAANQKEELTDLYLNKNRPQFDMVSLEPQSEVYVVPMDFYEKWTAFIKAPTRYSAPSTLDITSLLCIHDRFLYDPCVIGSGNSKDVVLVWPNEWQSLQQWYTNEDKQVCLLKIVVQDNIQYTSSPECCYECASLKTANEDAQAKDFGEADIYVYKCEAGDEAALKLLQRQKSKLQARRHRVPVGSSRIKVSSTMRLIDLKLELMNQYAVAPSDQHLWLEDVELVDGDKMLMQLDITPHCIVVLKVDEGKAGTLMDEFVKDVAASNMDVKESGFKGTRLIS